MTARARSPLQLTQESVAAISTMPDALEIVGVADNDNEMLAQLQPIVRDLSDPKYDFEIFEDENVCIHCSQSFTLEHYSVGSLFERYINRKVTKGIF